MGNLLLKCPECGNTFQTANPRREYCSYECKVKRNKKREMERYHSDPAFRKSKLAYCHDHRAQINENRAIRKKVLLSRAEKAIELRKAVGMMTAFVRNAYAAESISEVRDILLSALKYGLAASRM